MKVLTVLRRPEVLVPVSVFAVNLLLTSLFAVNVLYMDDWDLHIDHIYLPYLQGQLQISDFFRRANEHYVVWTKMLYFLLFRLNGDVLTPKIANLIQCVFPAGIAALMVLAWKKLNVPGVLSPLVIFLSFSLPICTDLLLWGLGHPTYQVTFFGIFLLYIITFRNTGGVSFHLQLFVLSLLTFFSFGSSVVYFLIGALLCLWQAFAEERKDRLVAALFLLLLIPLQRLGMTSALSPFSAGAATLLKSLALAVGEPFLLAYPVLWLPLVYFLWRRLRRREKPTAEELFATAILSAVFLLCVSIALARPTENGAANRHLFQLLAAYGAMSLLAAGNRIFSGDKSARWQRLLQLSLILVLFITSAHKLHTISKSRAGLNAAKEHLNRVMAAEDAQPGSGLAVQKAGPIPYIDHDRLYGWLKQKEIRRILPR